MSSRSDTLARLAPIPRWCEMSGMSRSGTYDALARGQLRAKKLGGKTLIDVPHGLAWLESLPDATFRAPKDAA